MKLTRRCAVPLASAILLSLSAMPAVATETGADVNLALGKPYTVEVPYPDAVWAANERNWADTRGIELTDGRFASPADMSPVTGYLRGDKRVVTIDLGAEQTVRSVRASFFQNKGWGVFLPQTVTFSLSDDGEKWTDLGTVGNPVDLSAPGDQFQKYEVNGFNYIGRYVRVEIPTNVWVFIDEIEAFGEPGAAAGAELPDGQKDKKPKDLGFPKASKATGKARQQVLVYNGAYPADPKLVNWTEADFKPYVTYIDTAGKSQDFMFDSFLFLPIGKAASGREYGPAANPSNKVDWEAYLDQTFNPQYTLAALDRAVATAGKELGDKHHRAQVVLTIPFPSPQQANFGDVDGDGVSENLNQDQVGNETAAANRVKVTQWYIDQALNRWEAASFEHIDLVGFYWYGESVRYQLSPVEEHVMRQTNDYVHAKGYQANWIPYIQGEGFRNWEALGFDEVNMQPNYILTKNATVDRLQQVANLAKHYGMGIEMELNNWVLQNNATGALAREQFIAYLDYGWKTGYMEAFTNWYQQVRTLQLASQSTDPAVRQIYDLTYHWIKGDYEPVNLPADN